MDDLDAILADLQVSTNTGPPQPSPVYSEPFRPANSTPKAQQPLGESLRNPPSEPPLPPPPAAAALVRAPSPKVLNNSEAVRGSYASVALVDSPAKAVDHDASDDYTQELARLQEPSRSSNIEDLDNLLDDLNFVQKNYNPDRNSTQSAVSQRDQIQSAYDDFPEVARSSATKDLDNLMESLQSFNSMSADRHSYQNQGYDNLDGMMASLDTDLAKKGVRVNNRGMCSACDKVIVGKMVTALGKTWHPEHFVCIRCGVELGMGKFFERDDMPYCEEDYHAEFAPRCSHCNRPIVDRCITALQKTWHPDCFVCVHCQEPFTRSGTEYHVFEGKPYCKRDYYEMFAPKCGGCNKAIVNNVITALKRQWHVECFVCYECKNRFGAGTYYEHEGKPYCELHYHQHRGSLCAACNKPISGRVITAMRNKFHPEHFVCAFCITPLSKGTFKEHESKPYCHTCYQKLFGVSNRV